MAARKSSIGLGSPGTMVGAAACHFLSEFQGTVKQRCLAVDLTRKLSSLDEVRV